MRDWRVQVLVVVLACAAVYWPMLGSAGFASSEGHRVAPAWEMLRDHDWWHVRMFGLTYLRKPPGMPWAIGAMSAVFGETEFAARAVSALSATVMGVVAWWFTRKWLGDPWGVAGGLAQALMPLMVVPGRTAEIEALNQLGTQLGALGLVSLATRSGFMRSGTAMAMGAVGVVVSTLAKGPASVPVYVGVLVSACLVARSVKPVVSWRLWGAVGAAGVIVGLVGWKVIAANRGGEVVTQDFSEFTWSMSRIVGTVVFIPAAWAAAAPVSFGLFVPLFRDTKTETDGRVVRTPCDTGSAHEGLASTLALSWLITCVVLMSTGSSNARYAMPGAVVLPMLAACVVRNCFASWREMFVARAMMLGHAAVWPVLLLIAGVVWGQMDTRRPGRAGGVAAGEEIASHVDVGAEVWADDVIEARPDILLYAQRSADRGGKRIEARWKKSAMKSGSGPAAGGYLLIRSDDQSPEARMYSPHVESGEIRRVSSGKTGRYEWVLYRVERGWSVGEGR